MQARRPGSDAGGRPRRPPVQATPRRISELAARRCTPSPATPPSSAAAGTAGFPGRRSAGDSAGRIA